MEGTPQSVPPCRALHPSMRSTYSALRARHTVSRPTASGDLADVAQHDPTASSLAPTHTPTRSYFAPATCSANNGSGGRAMTTGPRSGPTTCLRSGPTRSAAYHYTPGPHGGNDIFAAEFFQRVHDNGTIASASAAATVANEFAQSVAAAAVAQDATNAMDSCSPSPSSVQTNPQFVNIPSISPARLGTMSVQGHDTLLLTSPGHAAHHYHQQQQQQQDEEDGAGANAMAALETRLAHATRDELMQLVLELSAVSGEVYDVAMRKSASFLFRHDLSAEFEREGRLLLLRQMSAGEGHGGQRVAYIDNVESASAAKAMVDRSGLLSNPNNVTEFIECFTNPHTNSSLLSERFSTMQESTTTTTTTCGLPAPHVLFANPSAQGADPASNVPPQHPRRSSMTEAPSAFLPFRSTPRVPTAWPRIDDSFSAKKMLAENGPALMSDTAPPYDGLDTVAASERAFVAARHPCLRWYGGCRYPTRCIYVDLPQNVCLNWLYGACTAGSRCVGVHRLPEDCPRAVRDFYALHHSNASTTCAVAAMNEDRTPSPLAKTTNHLNPPCSTPGLHGTVGSGTCAAQGRCAASLHSSPHTPGDQIMHGTPPPLVLCECPSPHPHTDALLARRHAVRDSLSQTRSSATKHSSSSSNNGRVDRTSEVAITHDTDIVKDRNENAMRAAQAGAIERSHDELVCRCLVNSFDRVASPHNATHYEGDEEVLGRAMTNGGDGEGEGMAEGIAEALVFGEPCATQASSPLLQTSCSYATLVYDEGRVAVSHRHAETAGVTNTKGDTRCGSPELRDYTRSQSPAS